MLRFRAKRQNGLYSLGAHYHIRREHHSPATRLFVELAQEHCKRTPRILLEMDTNHPDTLVGAIRVATTFLSNVQQASVILAPLDEQNRRKGDDRGLARKLIFSLRELHRSYRGRRD